MKFLNYLGDFCEYLTDSVKFIMPYFVVMACLKYLGFDWLIFIFIGVSVYLTIVNFGYNELKRQHKKLLTKQAILNEHLEILKRLKDDKPT